MKYRELLELYQNNELDEETRRNVAAEIEKQEAISEFIFDREEESLGAFSGLPKDQESAGVKEPDNEVFVKAIRSAVRKAFVKMGGIILALTVIIVLFIVMALPKIVSGFYYNPGKELAEDTNQMSLDLAVYTALTMPTKERSNVIVTDRGYGEYDISINQNISFNSYFHNIAGKISKGELVLYDPNVLNKPIGNTFAWGDSRLSKDDVLSEVMAENPPINMSAAHGKKNSRELIENLSEERSYISYVSLDRMMSYGEFMKYLDEHHIIGYTWCAVDTGRKEMESLGFQADPMYSINLKYDRDKYPQLFRWDDEVDSETKFEEMEADNKNAAVMETHFTSMLRYMKEQERFLKMMDDNTELYERALAYIENNGVKIYGYVVLADKDKLIEMIEHDEVYEIYTVEDK